MQSNCCCNCENWQKLEDFVNSLKKVFNLDKCMRNPMQCSTASCNFLYPETDRMKK